MNERDPDRAVSQTVRAQLALRDLILSGRLRPGERISELGAVENEYLSRSLDRVVEDACLRDPGYAETPMVSAHRMRELTDNDLLHMVFGVAT